MLGNSRTGSSKYVVALTVLALTATVLFFSPQANALGDGKLRIALQRDVIHKKLQRGQIDEGARDLLSAIRAHSPRNTKIVDYAYADYQLLAFTLTLLMDDGQRQLFLQEELKTGQSATDALVYAMFLKVYHPYQKRDGSESVFSEADVRRKFQELALSDNRFVEAAALYNLADPHHTDFEDIPALVSAMNRLAERYPDLMITQDAFRRLMYVCRADKSALLGLFDAPPNAEWNDAVKTLIGRDPVVALVRQDAQRADVNTKALVANALRTALNDQKDAYVRYWCLAFDLPCKRIRPVEPERVSKDLKTSLKGRFSANSRIAASIGVPIDTTRAEWGMFNIALGEGDFATASDLIGQLLDQKRISEPFDFNLYEFLPHLAGDYAGHLEEAGRTEEAATIHRKVAALYPASELARRADREAARVLQGE